MSGLVYSSYSDLPPKTLSYRRANPSKNNAGQKKQKWYHPHFDLQGELHLKVELHVEGESGVMSFFGPGRRRARARPPPHKYHDELS